MFKYFYSWLGSELDPQTITIIRFSQISTTMWLIMFDLFPESWLYQCPKCKQSITQPANFPGHCAFPGNPAFLQVAWGSVPSPLFLRALHSVIFPRLSAHVCEVKALGQISCLLPLGLSYLRARSYSRTLCLPPYPYTIAVNQLQNRIVSACKPKLMHISYYYSSNSFCTINSDSFLKILYLTCQNLLEK